MLYVGRLQTAHGTRVRHKIRILVRHRRDARLEAGRVQCMRHAREQVRMSEIDKKESYLLTYLPLLRRGRRTGLPRPRRARRALAIAPWARGGAAWHARRPRRAFFCRFAHITELACYAGSAVSAVARQRGGLVRSSCRPGVMSESQSTAPSHPARARCQRFTCRLSPVYDRSLLAPRPRPPPAPN